MRWLKWVCGWVVFTLIGHYIWPLSEKLGEHALLNWIDERIAESFGIVGPSTEQMTEFVVSWSIPGLLAACVLLMIYTAYRVGGRKAQFAGAQPIAVGRPS